MGIPPVERLDNRPVTSNEFFRLMEPPRHGIGFANPLVHLSGRPQAYVGGCVEYEGSIVGVYYDGNTWVATDQTVEDVDRFMFDEDLNENFINRVIDEINVGIDDSIETADSEIQFEAPPGYQTKMCVFHRPLSPGDFETVSQWPQFADTVAIYGSPDHGIVGLTTMENVVDDPLGGNIVFSFFHPEFETWRIVDSISYNPGEMPSGDHIHVETGEKLREHYEEIEMICGPT